MTAARVPTLGITMGDPAGVGPEITAKAHARPEVKRIAHYVTAASGGSGAIREVAELLLQAQGHWSDILKKYEVD